MQIGVEGLIEACGDSSQEAGLVIASQLVPLGGAGAPVKPAVYAGGRYQLDRRWTADGEARQTVDVVVIDNVPSQANRLEAALQRLRPKLGIPEMELDLSECGSLPPHLPRTLSGFRFPHRQADAYLRDAMLDGSEFPKTAVGQEVMTATGDNAAGLLQWFPQALLFGFWQSHLGKKRSQAKLARSWVSEIAGFQPASTETRVLGLKGDPLNLSVDEKVTYDPEDLLGTSWQIGEEKKAGGTKKRESLSELGHGQVPVTPSEAALGGVSFADIRQRTTLSFASLRRVSVGSPEANGPARALLASLGIVAHVGAFGGAFSLRSGCDLRATSSSWTWLGASRDESLDAPGLSAAIELFRGCVDRAEAAGLPVGTRWATEPLRLLPNAALEQVIRRTYVLGL
jgi:CRISPR-associated protein Csb1